ncbi:tyrosine-type recombinase/integrase [Paraburkholderia panacisoli]|uniref:Tyrosine-type recombinase/integrase n=1 Tax=Paraburkholderia panacisoli TaxID=2603818 RepID=A0A5B0HCI2_9BURK|nr:tyrosine-type recombinase/integrase [Paraburkholderia panacisoli]KAA1012975.1 tyrosine-type recombinase/integrase [Paraburkholderia panacisoli]
MATRKKAKYPRVYPKHGAWYWVEPRTGQWIRLCEQTEPESKLLERLGQERKRFERPEGVGDMRPLIDEYVQLHKAKHKERAWKSYGKYAGSGFRNANVKDVRPTHVSKWLKTKYEDKLPMQRVMRAFLSGFFQWCVDDGKIDANPCKEVKLKKPKPSTVYITDEHFSAIRAAMVSYEYTWRGKTLTSHVKTGAMMQCFVDLCYLTMQRSTEIRLLKWSQVDEAAGVIHFLPTKTEDSSGIAVDIVTSPEIAAVISRIREIDGKVKRIGEANVIHAIDGSEYEATAVRAAWLRAVKRVGLQGLGYTVKSIRAKGLTDASKAGYDITDLQEAAAHSTSKQTEDYIKRRTVPVSEVRLKIPKRA